MYTSEGLEELNKLKEIYEPLGYKCFMVSATKRTGIAELMERMKGKTCLVSGHSGVGKSTLINAIDPGLALKMNELSEAHDKGKHTTTFAEMFPLNQGGYIIDTPGIKEFGIIDIEKNELGHFFPEIRERMNDCKFNSCLHVSEPGCAVIKAVEKNEIAPFRYTTYLNILLGDELKKQYE
jgi:ribosome biogenesis GTPase